jgi:drug/metabolite transporter (DMT)-like permease
VLAFIGFVLLVGGASLSIRYLYTELAQFWSATLRFGSAALIFWVIVLAKRIKIPTGKALLGAVIFGALSVGLPFLCIGFALISLPASLYQTIASIVPLLTLLFAILHGQEKFSSRGLLGALLATAGIAVALSGSLAAGVQVTPLPVIAAVLGAASLAEASVVAKLFPRNNPFATNAIGGTVGGLMLGVVSKFLGETWNLPVSTGVWLALIYLVVGITVVVFTLYLFILGRWSASAASYGFVLVPIVTVILAATLVGETITWVFLVGVALVLTGVWLGVLMPARKQLTPTLLEDCPPPC